MLDIGDVFLLRDFATTGVDPHYRIVVHKTASNDLVLVYTNTDVEKVKKRCYRVEKFIPSGALPDTFVEIPLGMCPALPKLCAVNCNKAYMRSESDCINGFDFKIKNGKLDISLIAKIRYGIGRSDDVEQIVIDALNK